MSLYSALVRPLLFRLDAETAHEFALSLLARLPPPLVRMAFPPARPADSVATMGLEFPNPVGLAAGMDKDAVALPAWEALGFGFVEVGTVTARAQPGNPKPRAFRYPSHRALINRMGFNNQGAEAVANRLHKLKNSGRWPKIPVGINIGKSKVTPLDQAPDDYRESMRALSPYGDYFVINVSSPNTPGLRNLQAVGQLRGIAEAVIDEACGKPVLVKIAPDLASDDAAAILELAVQAGLAGIIATNTTLDHSCLPAALDQQGGLSGAPLEERSTALLRQLAASTHLPIIASGGVMDCTSARKKFDAGATLIQVYTGFVYQGPSLIGEIVRQWGKFGRDQTCQPDHK